MLAAVVPDPKSEAGLSQVAGGGVVVKCAQPSPPVRSVQGQMLYQAGRAGLIDLEFEFGFQDGPPATRGLPSREPLTAEV